MNEFFTEEMVEKILSNPFYCMTIDSSFCMPHKPIISKEDWIKANVKLIKDLGAEKWLYGLIQNLSGDYV